MKQIELALIMKTIDAHTVKRHSNYAPIDPPPMIEDVAALKRDIIKQYECVMREEE